MPAVGGMAGFGPRAVMNRLGGFGLGGPGAHSGTHSGTTDPSINFNRPGLVNSTTQGGAQPVPQQPQQPQQQPSFNQPAPGVSGITPGAIQRRLGGNFQVPPTAQANPSIGMPPTSQAMVALQGNTVGADPRAVNDPLAMLLAILEGKA